MVALQLTAGAVDAFERKGIHLDTSITLPAFQDPFPYHLLFTWVSIIQTISIKHWYSYFIFIPEKGF